jgi:iron(III) transport system permease protein
VTPAEVAAAARPRGRRPPILLTLAAAAVTAAALLPLAYLVVRALDSSAAERASVQAGPTARLVLDTALLVGGVVGLALVVGVPLAWLVVRTDLPGRRALAVLAALPLVVPSYVAALALLGALGPRGLLQDSLAPLGIERLPEIYGYEGAVLALTLSTYPYVFLLAAAALRGLDASAEEAARSLGARPGRVFFRVTLPALRPTLAAASLLVALYVLSDFGAVSLMQYPTLTRAVYLRYESLLDRGSAAILALVLVGLALVVVLLEARVRVRGAGYQSAPGAGRQARPVPLGHWRWPALAFVAAVVGVFLALPIGVLAWWARSAADLDLAWSAALDSVVAAGLAAGAASLAALPVAALSWGYPSRLSRTLERSAYLPNAVPGIAIALALVFFGARYGGVLYQSLAMLVFAYVVRFLPQALAPTRAALEGIDPRLQDASRSLGRGRLHTFTAVVVPLARPGILAGAALVFLSTLKELPATLLLRPIGFDTLATETWKHALVGDYPAAALPALLLVAVAAPFVYALSGKRAWELGAPG